MYGYFDIGGTKTRVTTSIDGKTFTEVRKFDTPTDCAAGIELITHTLRELSNGQAFRAVGGGIAGPLSADHTTLVRSPHLPDWVGKPITTSLQTALGISSVYLENDSAIVGLGEAHHGAGKGDPIMAYITVSTGVGGVRIVDGVIDRSSIGFEPGHQILDIDHTLFPTEQNGEAEELLSGTSVAERFNKKAYEITDPAVWEDLARTLAYLLNNVAVLWSPHAIVLGGSMMVGNPAIPIDRVIYHLQRVLTIFPTPPTLKLAALNDLGGLYGALTYVQQQENT
jgi:glucokinase